MVAGLLERREMVVLKWMRHAIRCDQAVALSSPPPRVATIRRRLRRLIEEVRVAETWSVDGLLEMGRSFRMVAEMLQREIPEDDGYGSQE